jgi:hypothetical protein
MGKYRARKNPVNHVAVSQPAFSFESNTRPDNPLAGRGKFLPEAGQRRIPIAPEGADRIGHTDGHSSFRQLRNHNL